MALIEFQNVSKTFALTGSRILLRDYLGVLFRRRSRQPFYALRNVSFSVDRGEGVAIIGSNGAGKSTLLALVAGLSKPNEGTVEVNGRIAALLQLGAGFHPDLNGRENIWLYASLMGLKRKQAAAVLEQIVEFSGVEDFIDEPLRTYSSGMMMRLAFSVAVHCDPEILLIDEVLAVGDQAFQAKCFDKIFSLRRQGKTLLCVSHSTSMVLALCERAIWLEHGHVTMQGRPSQVLEAYSNRSAAPL